MAETGKPFIKAAKQGDLETVKTMVAMDRSLLEFRDSDGSTALHCACWKGHIEVASHLIQVGADVNAVNLNDHWGTTPLHAAAHANHAVIAELLIQSGANIQAKDNKGQTPLVHTTFHKATAAAKILAKHGAE